VRSVSDEVLAVAAAGGDGLAFEELARRYRPLICAAARWLPDGLEADDARQAALIGLWEACRATDGARRFAGLARRRVRWSVGVARRAAMAHKQRVLTDALHASDDGRNGLDWIAAPEGVDPARVVELRDVMRERVREEEALKRRRAIAPGGDMRRRYTAEQRERVLATFVGGASIREAASAAGVKYRRAHEWLTSAPADSPAGRELAARRDRTPGGVLGRRFSDEDRARAVALVADGSSVLAAARAVGATWPTVQRWLDQAA
jgi:RNA polymerase sigma factor (sigma-70 family)